MTEKYTYREMIRLVQAVLTPDLLKPVFRQAVEDGAHPLTGHCYVACESLYFLLGGKKAGLKPVTLRVGACVHWWLVDSEGEVIDPTRAQFPNPVDYAKGRPRGFLTRAPSKRAREVIRRVSTDWQGDL
jgi:hypothetical protein